MGLGSGASSLRRASKRKCPTPTASVTDLESMERTLVRQQTQQTQQIQQAQQQHGLPPTPRPLQQQQPQGWRQQAAQAAAAAAAAAAPAAAPHIACPKSGGGRAGSKQPEHWSIGALPGSGSGVQAFPSGLLLWPSGMQQCSPPATASSSPKYGEQSTPEEQHPAERVALPPLLPPAGADLGAAAAGPTAGAWQAPPHSPLRIRPLQGAPGPLLQPPQSLAHRNALLASPAAARSEAVWAAPGGGPCASGLTPALGASMLLPLAQPPPPSLHAVHQHSPWMVGSMGDPNSGSGPRPEGLPTATPPPQLPSVQYAALPSAGDGAGRLATAGAAAEASLLPDTPSLAVQPQPPLAGQSPRMPMYSIIEQQAAVQPASLPVPSPALATRALQELASVQLAEQLFGPMPPQ